MVMVRVRVRDWVRVTGIGIGLPRAHCHAHVRGARCGRHASELEHLPAQAAQREESEVVQHGACLGRGLGLELGRGLGARVGSSCGELGLGRGQGQCSGALLSVPPLPPKTASCSRARSAAQWLKRGGGGAPCSVGCATHSVLVRIRVRVRFG